MPRSWAPGRAILIHATPREMKGRRDWTAGRMAMTDCEVEDVYAMVRNGTPIAVFA